MSEDMITNIMDITQENCENIRYLEELNKLLQIKYGISYNEYMTIRNEMLIEFQGKLPRSVFEKTISQLALDKALIKLVAKGMLDVNTDLNFQVSEKGINVLANSENKMPKEEKT